MESSDKNKKLALAVGAVALVGLAGAYLMKSGRKDSPSDD